MSVPAVETEGLGRDYGSTRALDALSLRIPAGALVGLLGPNGAGKTTTMLLLATLLAPTRGRARVFGHDTARERRAVRRRLGLVFQEASVDGLLTVEENLVFAARLTARGLIPAEPLPVVLYEKQGDRLVERARVTVTPDPAGNPVPVKLTHTPTEAGEKVFVLEVPAVEGEKERENNRLERAVLVTEPRAVRVLFIEGRARYDFRFVKVLFEREAEAGGARGVEFRTVLLDASPGWAATDKSAEPLKLRKGELPTRTELFAFDVIVLGDFDPKQTLRSPNEALRDRVPTVESSR